MLKKINIYVLLTIAIFFAQMNASIGSESVSVGGTFTCENIKTVVHDVTENGDIKESDDKVSSISGFSFFSYSFSVSDKIPLGVIRVGPTQGATNLSPLLIANKNDIQVSRRGDEFESVKVGKAIFAKNWISMNDIRMSRKDNSYSWHAVWASSTIYGTQLGAKISHHKCLTDTREYETFFKTLVKIGVDER